jgi:hypothetical protein
VAQLFDDFLDRIVEVDAVDFTARHQNVVDRDVVQRMDARQRVRAADAFGFVVMLGSGSSLFLHHFGFALERSQQQLAGGVEQPGQPGR